MSTADIIIVILLGFGAVKGYLQGFIIEIFSLLAFFVGIILALQLTIPATTRFFGDSTYFDVVAVFVFIALFVLLSVAVRLIGRFIKSVVHITILGKVDNFIGGLTGILKWTFLISVIFWVLESTGFEFQRNLISDSYIFPYIVQVAPKVFSSLGELIPFLKNLIDSMQKIPKTNNTLLKLRF